MLVLGMSDNLKPGDKVHMDFSPKLKNFIDN